MDWGRGEYERTAALLIPAAEAVIRAAELRPGGSAIDVGCGTGTVALLTARAGAHVTAVDPADRLLGVARSTADREGLTVRFLAGDAASLPVPDLSMDAVLSNFAAIFAPDPAAAVAEMVRVLAPRGRIVFSAWWGGGEPERGSDAAVSHGGRRPRAATAVRGARQGRPGSRVRRPRPDRLRRGTRRHRLHRSLARGLPRRRNAPATPWPSPASRCSNVPVKPTQRGSSCCESLNTTTRTAPPSGPRAATSSPPRPEPEAAVNPPPRSRRKGIEADENDFDAVNRGRFVALGNTSIGRVEPAHA